MNMDRIVFIVCVLIALALFFIPEDRAQRAGTLPIEASSLNH